MKALIYITIFLMSGIWFTSCKTSRNIETQKQIDYSGDFLYLRNLIESLRLDVNKQTKITTDKLSDLKIENTTVYLSDPDSTGKQYPVKESTTTASKQEQERIEVDETLSITLQQLSNRLDTISNKVNVLLNQKETVVELSWWDLHKDKVYIGIIGFHYFLSRSRISLSSSTSSGVAGSSAGAGSSFFFSFSSIRIARNIKKAIIRKSMMFWMN